MGGYRSISVGIARGTFETYSSIVFAVRYKEGKMLAHPRPQRVDRGAAGKQQYRPIFVGASYSTTARAEPDVGHCRLRPCGNVEVRILSASLRDSGCDVALQARSLTA